MGFWSVNLRTGLVTWDATSAAIHGKPPGHTPTLHQLLEFFGPAERARVVHAALSAFESRTLFDIETTIEVDGGIRVRLMGGRGYEPRSDAAELHGVIEMLSSAPHGPGPRDDEDKEVFCIAAILHELQARMASIATYSALAESESRDPQLARARLARIARTSAHVQRIIEVISHLRSETAPRRRWINGTAMAASVLKAHVDRQPAFANAWVAIAPGIELHGDPAEVELLLDNLMGNALKFSATRSPPHVQVSASEQQGRTVVHVSDNGIGLAAEDKAGMFKLFARRCPAAFEGTGVGLALCRRIVERHGGMIWAEGAAGEGATFSFYL
jgi:signal transduction histidine kinase